jgi:hypothetical protein
LIAPPSTRTAMSRNWSPLDSVKDHSYRAPAAALAA